MKAKGSLKIVHQSGKTNKADMFIKNTAPAVFNSYEDHMQKQTT